MIAKVIIVVLLALVAAATALPHKRAGVPNPKTVHHEVAVPKPKQNEPKKLVCYYGSWAVYRPGDGKFDIEDIDPYVCTHLIFGFASLSVESWEIEAFDPWNDLDPEEGGGKGAYRRFNELKNVNPKLLTIIAIGGWNAGSANYSEMAADPAKRTVFVRSCVEFVKKYGFDGLDMDWEYPTYRGGDDDDKQHFSALLYELRDAFKAANLLLTSAVSPAKFKIEEAYDIQALIDTLDLINVMAYDYHGAWAQYVHHNAPVYQHPLDIGYGPDGEDEFFNQNYTMHYWVELMKENSHRLMMGMPLYGRGFTLDDPNDNGIHANATYPGRAGPYTRQPGVLGYNEQCEVKRNQSEGFTEHWDDIIQAKHCIFKNETTGVADQWFAYEDVESLEAKLKLLHSLPVGGGMVWSIETDDFHNVCGKGVNPLLHYLAESLQGGSLVTPDPQRTTTRPSVTPPSGQCTHPGLNAVGTCSDHYLMCVQDVDGSWIGTPGQCADGTVVNPDLGICDYPDHVSGCATYKQ
jgi:chitinase